MAPKSPPMREQKTKPMDEADFTAYVINNYDKSWRVASELWRITLEFGSKNEPCSGGFFNCTVVGGRGRGRFVMITDNSGPSTRNNSTGKVASTPPVHYTSSIDSHTRSNKENVMPARGRRAAEPAVEAEATEPENGEKDYTSYATKAPTAAMQDFHTWLVEVGAAPEFGTQKEKDAFGHGVRLGGTLRMEFQKSDVNQANRASRRAEREAAVVAEPVEEAEVEAAPKRAARGKAAATSAAPKRVRGKPVPISSGTAAPY
jgi:hypothetical protein